MAQIQDTITYNPIKAKPKSNTCFQGCFGFSRKISQKENPPHHHMVNSSSRRRFSWSRFRAKNSDAKTVPVDTSSSEKVVSTNGSKSITPNKSKVSSRHHITANVDPSQIPAAVKPPECTTRPKTAQQSIILESSKSCAPPQANPCQRRLFSNSPKIQVLRSGVSQPGSPVDRSKNRQSATVLYHSASFPVQKAVDRSGKSRVKPEKKHRESDTLAGKLDPVVGMSIVMVTLIIMLVWGRLCAILCTCAWFYVIPCFKVRVESREETGLGESDLNSEEYKKKVVLEGFLERNHRNAFGSS